MDGSCAQGPDSGSSRGDDRGWLDRATLLATSDAEPGRPARHDLKGALLLPGFIDTQVNGGGGVLFNDDPSVETIRRIGAAHRKFGTTGFLPTLISDDLGQSEAGDRGGRRRRFKDGVPGVLGIHIEGPFLSPARKGVHDPSQVPHPG